MTTRLFLVRHGCTESNRDRRYMGRSEEGLSSEGRWQARQLARRLAGNDLAAIYSSPLRRTKETAQIAAHPHRLDVGVAAEFNELDLSRWVGLTAAEIEAREPEAWDTWCADPASLALPGIEPFDALRQRVRRGLEGLTKRHAGAVVAVVTHDGVIRIAVLEALGMSMRHYRAIAVSNTGMTVLDFTRDRTYLRAHNDTGHLSDGLDVAPGPADR